jgi:RimJ/RimL family protein N-acetyltransferase
MSRAMPIELQSERLRLRNWREDDVPFLADLYASDTAGYVGGPMSLSDTWRRIALFIGHWALRGFGNWVLEEKATGRPVGYAGLWQPHGWPEPEVMWALAGDCRGQGYATEAARRARDFAFAELGWPTAVSYINPDNEPSRRVAMRLEARLEPQMRSPGGNEVWRHLTARPAVAVSAGSVPEKGSG